MDRLTFCARRADSGAMKRTTLSRRGFPGCGRCRGGRRCGCRERRPGIPARRCGRRPPTARCIGVSKWELDTPALCVDLDTMDRNIATMKAKLASSGVATRPHAKTHKCPAIARLQLATGSIGVCAAKVSEAEVLSANGIEPILMTTSNVTPAKIRRAMQIRKSQPAVRPGRGLSAERARPVGRREGSGRRRRCGRRCRGGHADRRAGRRSGAGAGPARRHAAEPQAARHDQLRRRRAAHQGLQDPPRAHAAELRAVGRDVRACSSAPG